MKPPVKSERRSYDNTGRARSSRSRQLRVAEVAAELLVKRGYAATTMAEVAAVAEVSVPWLYKVFGPKPALVKRAYDVLLSGDADRVPLGQRPAFRAFAAENDPYRAIEQYAAISRDLITRVGPLAVVLLSEARSADPDLAVLAATIGHERLIGATAFTDHLAELGALAPGVTRQQTRDVVWTLISPEVYRMLVLDRGWSGRRYEHWLTCSLTCAVLRADRPDGGTVPSSPVKDHD